MPYQDFLQKLRSQQQSQPIVLPEYDLPTQVDPVDPVKSSVEKIFGRSSADKTVQAVVEPEPVGYLKKKPKTTISGTVSVGNPANPRLPKDSPFDTVDDLLNWKPSRPIDDAKRLGNWLELSRKLKERSLRPKQDLDTIDDLNKWLKSQTQPRRTGQTRPAKSSRTIPYTRQVPEVEKESSYAALMDFRGPSEVEKMADRAIIAGREQEKREAATRSMLEGVDTGRTKIDSKSIERQSELQRMRRQVESENLLIRLGRRLLTSAAGGLKPEEEFINAPVGDVEEAVNRFAGQTTRLMSSIPEGFARIGDRLLNQGDLAMANAYRKIGENHPEQKAELEAKARQIETGLSDAGSYFEPISKFGEEAARGVYPVTEGKERTINPLNKDFWTVTMPEAAGSLPPFLMSAGIGRAAGLAPELVAGLTGAAMEVPERYHEARAAGATPEQLARGVDVSMLAGGLESVGAQSLLGKVGLTGKSIPRHFGREAGQEFIQEATQSVAGDVGDKYYAGTKQGIGWSHIGMNALQNAVPALFLGAGGAGLSVPQHLAEQRANKGEIPRQIESLANSQPDHPVIQALEVSGIDPKTITQADERAVEELSVRLQAMAKMDSQIQQMQAGRDLLAQQAQNAQDAQLLGRVPATVDAQAVQQLPVVEQQLAEAVAAKEAVGQDIQQNVSPLFRNLAKAVGQSGAQPLSDVDSGQEGNLLAEVRKAGGMSAAKGQVEKGELDRLSPKELETTGLISRKAGLSPDVMRERMVSEGLSEAETAQDFIGEVEAAARRPKTEVESYADYQRGQMTEEEQADSDNLDALLEDRGHPFTQAYRALDNPKTIYSPKLARDFVSAAEKAGFSGDFIERSLVEFQRQRGIGGQGAMEPDFAEKPGRSMKTSQPGIAPSLSPYEVLEANNKDLLKRLYDVNLNSNEGKQGIQALRDYARNNGIEQRHVNAHISDIQNWQAKYGVPKNPDSQQSQATRTEPTVKEKAPQSARSERPTPKSGFSLEQRKMLGREVESLADDEFDEYLGELEKIQAQTIKGAEFGGFDISEGERKGLATKMRQTRGERHKRVKAGRLKALFPAKQGVKQPSKAKLSEEARKTVAGNRETESVPRETEKVSQPQVGDYWNFTEPAIGYKAGKPFTYQQTLRGRVEKINPDGTVELRQQRGGFVTKHPSDLFIKGEKSQAEPVETAKKRIDEAAHEAATSPKNDLPEPTQAQKEAGNYQKGHINLHGLDITIENPEGSVRSGVGEDGKKWEVEMDAHYGYIRRTEGADEEQIDVYVGSKLDSNKVFVVDQIDPETGEFDEHKVILGAKTQAEAEKLYDAHFDDKSGPDRRGAVTEMSVDEFKSWLKNEDNTKPVGEIEEKAELIPLPKKNSIKRIDGVLHSSVDAERVGELNFELWENESYGGMTMLTRDAETGEELSGSVISDTNADRAKRRFKEKVETARQALGERSDEQAAVVEPKVLGETSGEAVAETSAVAKGDERGMLRTPETAADASKLESAIDGELDDIFGKTEGILQVNVSSKHPKAVAREQAVYDPELDSPVSRPMAARRREDVENSSEFKKWFGQSKVVDESGKPMPLYHGTQARNEIEAVDPARFLSGSHFGPGFYMAESPEIASQGYAEGHLHPRGQEVAGSPSVYKLYAKVENPLDMSKSAESKMIAAVFGSPSVDLEEMGFGSRPTNEVMYKQLAKRMGDDKGAVNQKLQEMGYDGITRLNRASEESPEHREWVVFQPNQVKSATGNRGTFDESANLSTARRAAAGPASQLANPMDVLLHAETLTKTRGTRGARMFVNDHARALLGASLTEVFGEDYSNVASINLSRDEVTKVAEYLEGEAANLTGDYQVGANRFVGELRDLLKQAKPSQRTFNIVDITPFEQRYQSGFRPDAERAVETFKSDVREESFHWSQREIGGTAIASVGSSWAQSSKGFGKYRRALLKLGYADDPEILAAETAAKIAAGKFDDLGIRTEADHQQADNWLASYFERIADKHGVEVLSQFDKLLPRASKAREQGVLSAKERINQRIAEESAKAGATANRPRAPGESGDGVRTGDQKARQEKSAESVPRRSADEPFESVPQADVKQAVLFDEKGLPRKSWGNMWANLGDVLNLPKALRASGDLSAAGRQGFFLSIPPSRWKLAAKAFGRGVASSEAMGLKKGAYQRLKQDLKAHPAYKEMVAAGWVPLTSDEGHLSAETELFGSRFAGKIPWAKYSEQAYKMNLDWLALSTFELYKKSIDKSVRDPKERFEGYQAAVDWINVSSGRGSYSGRFGQWYKEKPAPFLNVIGWAPGLVYSRFQILNPVTYAKNLKNPQSRVVFRKQMSELFQSAAVLFVTGALAKAAGALISTDPEEADFLKIRFGTTRYDVLAGLQQVARLSLRIGDYLRTKATTDTSTEEGQKKVRKASGEATTALLRFGRTKLGPVPGFVVDWWNDWTKVTGERHAPGEFIDSFTEGNKVKGFADLAEDPLVSQVIPLFWADLVAAYEFGWRSGGTEGGLKHIAKVLPAGLGLGVQDYERPEWSKETAKKLDKFDLDPKFPKREYKEKEVDYQKRVKAHIADQEGAVNRFTSDPNMANQPLARQKTLLQYEMSEDGRSRMRKLDPADIEDDRTVRAWIQVGVERLKNDPVYKAMPEEDQKRAVQSYYGRMNKYRAEPATKQRGYQRPEYVDNDILQQKIKAAIEAQK